MADNLDGAEELAPLPARFARLHPATRSEWTGDEPNTRRPDHTLRSVGSPVDMAPLTPSYQARMLRLSGDPTGASPIDLNYWWRGLDPAAFRHLKPRRN